MFPRLWHSSSSLPPSLFTIATPPFDQPFLIAPNILPLLSFHLFGGLSHPVPPSAHPACCSLSLTELQIKPSISPSSYKSSSWDKTHSCPFIHYWRGERDHQMAVRPPPHSAVVAVGFTQDTGGAPPHSTQQTLSEDDAPLRFKVRGGCKQRQLVSPEE